MARAVDDLHTLAQATAAVAGEWRRAGGEAVDLASALDNLDSLSEAATRLPEVERTLATRVDEVETQLARMLELLGAIEGRLEAVERLTTAAEALNGRAEALERAAERLAKLLEKLPGV